MSDKKTDERFPKDKQFLVTKKVPSYKRIKDLELAAAGIKEHDIGDGWILPEQQIEEGKDEIMDLDSHA